MEAIAKAVETHVQAGKETKSQGIERIHSVTDTSSRNSSMTRTGDGDAPAPPWTQTPKSPELATLRKENEELKKTLKNLNDTLAQLREEMAKWKSSNTSLGSWQHKRQT